LDYGINFEILDRPAMDNVHIRRQNRVRRTGERERERERAGNEWTEIA
jgi:hypothetical protein